MIEPKPLPVHQGRVFSYARGLQRGRRRLLVVATVVGYPGLYVWDWLTGSRFPLPVDALVSFLLLAMTIVGGTLVWMWTRNRVDLGASLDERERQVRDQVYVRSYQLIGVVVTAIVVVLGLLTAFGSPVTIDFATLTPFIIGNAIYFPLLPSLVLAWSEEDLPVEEA